MNEATAQLVEAYLAGDLDAAQSERLLAAIDDPTEAVGVRRRLVFAGQLAAALDRTPAEAVARAVLARLDAGADRGVVVAGVERALRPRIRRPALLLLAAACLLAALAAGLWWIRHETPAGCRIATAGASAGVLREMIRLPATAGMVIRPGDAVIADTPVGIAFADGSRLDLAAGSRLHLQPDAPGRRVRLEAGSLHADIAAQEAPMHIATADARVEVVGTRFWLDVRDGRTSLEMYAGSVRVVRAGETGGRLVGAGESLRSGLSPSAWRELFPGGSLDGWQRQLGTWTTEGGVVRGQASADAAARLQSIDNLGDLELRCRLRVSGLAHLCEIQLGGYNWFFTIPVGSRDPDGWVGVELAQHGDVATCTADGVALVREIADGVAPRSGPLGFYVPIGTAIEIAEARIRTVAGGSRPPGP